MPIEKHYRISEAARLLGVSRGTIYNLLRGEWVVDFAPSGGCKGVKLIAESTVARLLERHRKRFR